MIKKFNIVDSHLCISVEAVAAALGGDDSAYNTVWMGCKRKNSSYINFPDPADRRRRWIEVDSLPGAAAAAVSRAYGDPLCYYHREQFLLAVPDYYRDSDSTTLYSLVRSDYNISPQRIDQYCIAAAWLRLIGAGRHSELFDSRMQYYAYAAELISSLHLPGLRVSNTRVLLRKLSAFQQHGIKVFLRKYNNQNSQKLSDIQVKFIINTYSAPIKLSIRETWRQYIIQARKHSWEIISEERCRQIINDPANRQIWMIPRDGTIAARNVLERTVLRRKPSFPDALWSMDGLTVQLRYADPTGAVRSDLYSVIVQDIYSDRVVGWSIGTTETSTLVQAAMRSAGRNTMMLPCQIQYDNSSANISSEVNDLLSRLSKHHFPTQPYNGKSKPIENLIGRLESYFMRHFPNFKGGNITARSLAVRANPDYLESQRKSGNLPSMDGAIAQFELAIRVFNATRSERDGMSPDERYQMEHPQRRKMDYLTIVDAYWVTRKDTVRYTKDGLTIQVNREKITYEVEADQRGVEDMSFRRKWLGSKFTVKYDPDDLSCIHLYNDDVWVAMAVQKYQAPMALADREPGEGEIISSAQSQRRQYLEALRSDHLAMREELEDEGLPVDLDFNLLHKDAYNRIEQRILDDLLQRSAMPVERIRTRKEKLVPIDLYTDEEADGSVINIDY